MTDATAHPAPAVTPKRIPWILGTAVAPHDAGAFAHEPVGDALVRDVGGRLWAVHSKTDTCSGVTVVRGWPHPHVAGRGSARGLAVIATPELVDYLRTHACTRHVHQQLGLCSVTVARLRRATLSQTWRAQREQWWHDRADDLRRLPAREFIARHGAEWMRCVGSSKLLGAETVNARRRRMYPSLRRPHAVSRRPNSWWRSSEVRSLLASRKPARVIADQLGITPGYVYALRMYLKGDLRPAVA